MDHRLDERYPVNLDGVVTDLALPEHFAESRIVDISESGLCALAPLRFGAGAIVKVQIGDCTLFGHVSYCDAEGPSFRTGIEVVRVLIGESNLSRLLNSILAEAMPSTPGVRA